MGSITVHGMVFGSSRIDGSLNRFNVGTMYGSLTVEGDLGAYVVASDAGVWAADEALAGAGVERIKTDAQLVVGRTLGQMHVGGRSLVDVTVVGDINSPSARFHAMYTAISSLSLHTASLRQRTMKL